MKMGDDREQFGDALREYRRRAKKTLGEVAREVGRSVSYISDIEHGYRKPPRDTAAILAFARAVSGPPDEFLRRAALARRGGIEVHSEDPARMELAAALARQLNTISPEKVRELQRLLGTDGEED